MSTATAASRKALGDYGEAIAERCLRGKGLAVLDRNWRCDEGELDLVLRDGDVLVVCEVKTRSGDVGGPPLEAVGEAKLERLKRLAFRWADAHRVIPHGVRIDLVSVVKRPRGAADVEHVTGVC